MSNEAPQPLAYGLDELPPGLGRTRAYQAISDGSLPAKKLGRRTIVLAADLEKYLASLPDAEIKMAPRPDHRRRARA